jgi:hypothetical protein
MYTSHPQERDAIFKQATQSPYFFFTASQVTCGAHPPYYPRPGHD